MLGLKSDCHGRELFSLGFGWSIGSWQMAATIGHAVFPTYGAGIADPGYNVFV
jgi:hypothetical protein